jgi:hypothetical protein
MKKPIFINLKKYFLGISNKMTKLIENEIIEDENNGK